MVLLAFLFTLPLAQAQSSVWMDFGAGRGVEAQPQAVEGAPAPVYDPYLAAPVFRLRPDAGSRVSPCLAVAMPMAPLEIWRLRLQELGTRIAFTFQTASGSPFSVQCPVPPAAWDETLRILRLPELLRALGVAYERLNTDSVGMERSQWILLQSSLGAAARIPPAESSSPFASRVRELGGYAMGRTCRVTLDAWASMGAYASRVMTFADYVCLQFSESLAATTVWGPDLDSGRSCLPTPREAMQRIRSAGEARYEFRLNSAMHSGWRGPALLWRTRARAVFSASGVLTVQKRLRFVPADSPLRARAIELVEQAQQIYNESARLQGFDFRYAFVVAEEGETFDETIRLHTNNGRSDASHWYAAALHDEEGKDLRTVVHELGHLFGWIDEYARTDTVRGSTTAGCLAGPYGPSVMCDTHANDAQLQAYHHYLVLRAMACEVPLR